MAAKPKKFCVGNIYYDFIYAMEVVKRNKNYLTFSFINGDGTHIGKPVKKKIYTNNVECEYVLHPNHRHPQVYRFDAERVYCR